MADPNAQAETDTSPTRCGDEWDDFIQREVAHTCDGADARMPATTEGGVVTERRRRDR